MDRAGVNLPETCSWEIIMKKRISIAVIAVEVILLAIAFIFIFTQNMDTPERPTNGTDAVQTSQQVEDTEAPATHVSLPEEDADQYADVEEPLPGDDPGITFPPESTDPDNAAETTGDSNMLEEEEF